MNYYDIVYKVIKDKFSTISLHSISIRCDNTLIIYADNVNPINKYSYLSFIVDLFQIKKYEEIAQMYPLQLDIIISPEDYSLEKINKIVTFQ